MEDFAWTASKAAAVIGAFLLAAFIAQWTLRKVRAHSGVGKFQRSQPRPQNTQQLIDNIEALGDYYQIRSVQHLRVEVGPNDWEWNLGSDLKKLATLARLAPSELELEYL